MKKHRIQRQRLRIAVLLTISMLLLLPINALAVTSVDWGKEASYAGDGNGIGSWSIVAGDGGYYIHLVSQYWVGGTLYLDNGKQITYNKGLHSGSNWNESPGSVISEQGNQVEFFIPADYFAGASTISVGNTNLAIANIPSISGGEGTGGEGTGGEGTGGEETGGGGTGGEETGGEGTGGEETGGGGTGGEETGGEGTGGEETGGGGTGGEETGGEEPNAPALEPTTSGKIVVDGSARDWEATGVQSIQIQDKSGLQGIDVTGWRAARDSNGNLYLCLEGNANKYQSLNWVGINLDGKTVQFNNLMNYTDGVVNAYQCDSNSDKAAPFVMEFMIPANYFQNENYTISFGGTAYTADMIPVLSGEEVGDDQPAAYDGIQIDGHFEDWDAVAKTEVSAINGHNINCLNSTAMVFDGDYVYIYLREDAADGASSAGSHSNGRYAITTDLGYTLAFQLTKNGNINGPDGSTAKHVGSQWEVAIPASELPFYHETLSFGLYMGEPFVKDVANLKEDNGNVGEFNGIGIDGRYDDWDAYPHTLIEYATPGTRLDVADAEGALYYANGRVFGHVTTAMPEHLNSKGGDFLAAISIAFNGDRNYKDTPDKGNFYPRVVAIDANNNVSGLNDGTRLENGDYTFYIFDLRTDPGTDPEWIRENAMGLMKVSVNGVKDEMEFELYMDRVAQYIGKDQDDLRTVEAQFGRLGQQWLFTAGTSTGPLLGILLCLGVCAVPAVLNSRKRREQP